MALTTFNTKGVAGGMAGRNMWKYTVTTTVNTYEEIATIKAADLPKIKVSMATTTNNLLAKIEYTQDGTNFFTIVDEFPLAKATTAYFITTKNANAVRISVKPAVAATHGTVVATILLSDVIISNEYRGAFAYEAVTVTNAAAIGLTLATYSNAETALITVESNPVRVRYDGTAPTTTEGHLLSSGDTIMLNSTEDIYNFKAIATGGNAALKVTYSR